MTEHATKTTPRKSDTVHGLVRLRIEVVGEDRDACRRLLRDLCDMIDEGLSVGPGYSVSKIDGSASCDVDTISPMPPACDECGRVMRPTPAGHTCTACGHRSKEPNTEAMGRGPAAGTRTHQPLVGAYLEKGSP